MDNTHTPQPITLPDAPLTERERARKELPEAINGAIARYRDRCWRGGDPTAERLVLEHAIEDYATALVTAALDQALPLMPSDDELCSFVELLATDAELQAREYAGMFMNDPADKRRDQEGWADHARMFRAILARLYGARHEAAQ